MSGPWARLGTLVSLSSTTVAVAVFTLLRKRAAPPPGFYLARGPPLAAPHVGHVGPARTPGLPPRDHRGGGRLRPAMDARGAAAGPLPGARLAPPPLRFPEPGGPGSH